MKRQIVSSAMINKKASAIIEALLDADQLKEWWGVSSSFIQKKDGGLYALTWIKSETGIKFIQTSKIHLLNIRSHLHLEDVLYINAEKGIIGPFTIKFDIEEFNTDSTVTITQSGFVKGKEQEWYYNLMLDSWPQVLFFLKEYLELH